MSKLKFKFKMTLVDGMRPTLFRINASALDREALQAFESTSVPNLFEGEITATVILSTVEISIFGVGSAFLAGSFNVALGDKNLFKDDQPLKVEAGNRFKFFKPEVELP